MINDNTIISSFNDRPTLLEWLKKVEEALKTDTATGVSVENPSVNSYIFKITFADGKTIASDTIQFPDSVKSVTIENGHIIVTMQAGTRTDLGVLNPYADTIVLNSGTNTTEIKNNAKIDGNLQVNGTITTGGKELTAVVANPTEETTETLTKIKIGNIAYAVGGGSKILYLHRVYFKDENSIAFVSDFPENISTASKTGNYSAFVIYCSNKGIIDFTGLFQSAPISGYYYLTTTGSAYNIDVTNVSSSTISQIL